jgi:integrase
LLLAQGVHPKIVQERLGHADISMTLNRYSHVTPDRQRSAADTLDAVFTRVS